MIISVPGHFFAEQRFHKKYYKHSVFNHTINFISEDLLISLHDSSRIASPMGIILNFDQDALKTLANSITSIRITSEAIYLDNKKVHKEDVILSDHNLLDALRNNRALDKQHINQLGQEISKELKKHQVTTNHYTSILNERINQLKEALANKSNIKDALEALIGFGEGLTPSGDDVICGVMVGLLYQGQIELFNEISSYVNFILQNKINATSIISKTFLTYGAEGFFIKSVLDLYTNLINKETGNEIIKQIAALGHTSGTDFLKGIMLGNIIVGNYNDL